jgi:putative holliday junction resolvase
MTEPKHSAIAASANSSPTPQPGRILALDYGQKRIGLAISDEAHVTAQPLDAFPRTNRRNDITRLRALIREQDVSEIVIGHPFHLDGSASEMSAEVRRFAERLRKHLSLPIHFVDERLTSWDAENVRAETGSSKDRDSLAAAIILRDFLTKVPQSHTASRKAHAAPAARKS